ncbi:Uncharacterised protein [Chlamydia trachomatis]|nr:Uncharacterised protein [Chlamydia trachomatis]
MIIKECAIKAGKKPIVIATPVSIPKCSVATTAPNPAERRAVWIKKGWMAFVIAWNILNPMVGRETANNFCRACLPVVHEFVPRLMIRI